MITEKQRDEVVWLIGTSASDCEISLTCQVETSPLRVLTSVATALFYMNEQGIEKVSHRKALVKAGRAALKNLGDM